MARLSMNLNAEATRMIGDATKVRTKMVGGALFIRPTDRTEGKNLPKGEKLIKLSKRNPNRAFSLVKFSVRGAESLDYQSGERLVLVPAGRGWFMLDTDQVTSSAAAMVRVALS